MSKKNFRIRIPASSSNLGAGFDCFGLALEIYNEYQIEINNQNDSFEIETNLDSEICPNNKENLFYTSFLKLLQKDLINSIPGIKVKLNAQIPQAGGFGSSATAVLAGLITANQILDNKYSEEELLVEASKIEKHPDNICASMLGAFCLSHFQDERLKYKKISWDLDVEILMLYPTNFRTNTQEAREVLSTQQSMGNCIYNLSHSALFTAAVISKDTELLQKTIRDKIHEEARLKLIPGATEIIKAAKDNSAHNYILGATISGSGASLILFVNKGSDCSKIQKQAKEIWAKNKLESESLLCKVSNSGALIY